MRLSAPIYTLKRRAKLLAREENVPLHQALDRVAAQEGFAAWSLLAARVSEANWSRILFAQLTPGDLVLLAARPRQGKTLVSLQLALQAMEAGAPAAFFTLEFTQADILQCFKAIGADPARFATAFTFDGSEDISADHVSKEMARAPRGTLVIIDYLQLLDQRRDKPPLMDQVRALRALAEHKGLIIVTISQIDRAYDAAAKRCPDLTDVRLPNAIDLSFFTKTCFLHDGEARFEATPQGAI